MKVLFTGNTPKWVQENLTLAGNEVISVSADEFVNEKTFIKTIG